MLSKSERIIRNEQSRDIGDTKHRTKTNIQTKYSQKTNKNMSKTEPTKKPAVTKVLARGKQFLLLIGHLSFYSCSQVMLDTTIRLIVFFCFMVFNVTFINISVISWRSVFLVEETGVPSIRE